VSRRYTETEKLLDRAPASLEPSLVVDWWALCSRWKNTDERPPSTTRLLALLGSMRIVSKLKKSRKPGVNSRLIENGN